MTADPSSVQTSRPRKDRSDLLLYGKFRAGYLRLRRGKVGQ